MRVIYNTCFADPWVEVAKKLQKDHGYEPIYWNGYHDDNSKILVKKQFPNVIYHPYFDAWKGIFPSEVKLKLYNGDIDIDFLKNNAEYELQAIRMMDRMDPDGKSFGFSERQRHYRNFVRHWTNVIKKTKPDLVISAIIPHRVYDYTLYLLCRFYGIQYKSLYVTQFFGRIFPVSQIDRTNEKLKDLYSNIISSEKSVDKIKESLLSEIIEYCDKIKSSYSSAVPYYMKEYVKQHKKTSGFFSLIAAFIQYVFVERKDEFFGKDNYIFNGFPSYLKDRNKCIEESHLSILQYGIMKIRANKFKKALKKHYNSLCSEPDFNKKYILFNLHYQPEASTNPAGDIFTDQQLCIDMLVKYLPNDYMIYIKEHPAQFYSHLEGHTSRLKEFYSDLKKYSQVRLMPIKSDPLKLVNKSTAVSTVTGTVGFEAMVLQKPVIIFGLTWYERYKGVLKVTDENTGSKIKDFIASFKYDEKQFWSYLKAFEEYSTKAYFYRGFKEKMDMTEKECVDNICELIINN